MIPNSKTLSISSSKKTPRSVSRKEREKRNAIGNITKTKTRHLVDVCSWHQVTPREATTKSTGLLAYNAKQKKKKKKTCIRSGITTATSTCKDEK
jgi:hypothetical protein